MLETITALEDTPGVLDDPAQDWPALQAVVATELFAGVAEVSAVEAEEVMSIDVLDRDGGVYTGIELLAKGGIME